MEIRPNINEICLNDTIDNEKIDNKILENSKKKNKGKFDNKIVSEKKNLQLINKNIEENGTLIKKESIIITTINNNNIEKEASKINTIQIVVTTPEPQVIITDENGTEKEINNDEIHEIVNGIHDCLPNKADVNEKINNSATELIADEYDKPKQITKEEKVVLVDDIVIEKSHNNKVIIENGNISHTGI